MICPVCKKPLKDGEQLILLWYEPCKWWVVEHGTREDPMKICGNANAAEVYPGLYHNPSGVR